MIKTDIRVKTDYTPDNVREALMARLPLLPSEVKDYQITRRILNIKDKTDIHYDMTVALDLGEERETGLLKIRNKVKPHGKMELQLPPSRLLHRPVVVGAGPAGLFAALILAEAGARPILIERGLPVEERIERVEQFERLGILDTECNVQFGEGGAGTYSDGKLKVGSHDKYKLKVLRELVLAGAPDEILYSMNGHLGTDRLTDVVRTLRERIIALGGSFEFSTRLVGIKTKNGRVSGTRVAKFGREELLETDTVILAIGHSARDSFALLESLGVAMEARGFGIGMRVEHLREYTDRMTYGGKTPPGLGSASYHLVTHLPNGRSVYSFCMCPGGSVVAATSTENSVVTNGMSRYNRDAENSNSALLVSVTPADFRSDSPLAGFELQRRIEEAAFLAAGRAYRAPAVRMDELLAGSKPSGIYGDVAPSYPRGTAPVDPSAYLPGYVTDSLRAGISDFDAWMPGFLRKDAVLTGPETRSTSPVRILRGDDLASVTLPGLYPAGECGGYAGGIVSSAADGVRAAVAILEQAWKKSQ